MNKRMAQGLVALESKLDAVLFGSTMTAEEEAAQAAAARKRKGIGGVIAAPVAAGAGALALRKRYGADQIEGVGNQVSATARGAMREAGDIAGRAPGAMKSAVRSFRGSRTMQKAGVLKAGVNAVKKGAGKLMGMSAKDSLQELGERLDGVLTEFRDVAEEKARAKGQDPKNNLRRGLAAGVGGYGAGFGGVKNAKDYQAAGKVYRKRDAVKHGAVGYGAGSAAIGAGLLGAASIAGGRAGIKEGAGRLIRVAAQHAATHPGRHMAIGAATGAAGAGISYAASRAAAKRDLKRRVEAGQ